MRRTIRELLYMKLGEKFIDKNSPCFIIAEIGINHNGDTKLAKDLIKIAKEIDADAVKFQSFIPEELYSSSACPQGIELLNKYKLTFEQQNELFEYARSQNIVFLSTPFEFKSAEFLNGLGVEAFKIGSGEVNYYEFLKYVASFKKPMIISTGSSNLADVEKARDAIYATGNTDLIILHCVSAYPAPDVALNLKALKTLQQAFPYSLIGYSDHSVGIEAAVIATTLGARVIEKHFTLDKNMEGPDQKASSDPEEFKVLIQAIRRTEKMLGNGVKEKQNEETRYTRSLMATRNILAGELIKAEDIVASRPPGGIDPEFKYLFVGRKAVKDISKDDLLFLDMV